MTEGQAGRPANGASPRMAGRYHLLEPLSKGGMAEVFRAALKGPQGFEKTVAVKRILPHLSTDEEFRKMFIDEAKIATVLTHPNIVQVYELGEEEGSLYIVMEFVDGEDLRSLMDRAGSDGLPSSIAAFIGRDIARALDYAHRKGVIHRDVSPHNLLLSREGVAKLADFGIAKASLKASETSAGMLKGKFAYMSPEQAGGLPLDARTDIFSLGIVLYEMLAGQRLFLSDTDMSTLKKVQDAKVPRLSAHKPQVPRNLEDAVLHALRKNPNDRFASAGEMAEEMDRVLVSTGVRTSQDVLTEFLKDEPCEATSGGTRVEAGTRGWREGRPSVWAAGISSGIVLLGLLGLLGLVGTGFWFYSREAGSIRMSEGVGHSVVSGLGPTGTAAAGAPTEPVTKSTQGPVRSQALPEAIHRRADRDNSAHPSHTAVRKPPNPVNTPHVTVRREGTLNIGSKPWAEVYIDGVRLDRTTPVTGVKVSEGRHRVRFVNPVLNRTKEVAVDVKGGVETPLIVDLLKDSQPTPSGQ